MNKETQELVDKLVVAAMSTMIKELCVEITMFKPAAMQQVVDSATKKGFGVVAEMTKVIIEAREKLIAIADRELAGGRD